MSKFENPNQRNLEEDRASFIEAISNFSINEIPTTFDEKAVQELTKNIEENKLFILGELHGVKENADIIYTLFKKFGFRQLALEWDPRLKTAVEKYLESGELDFEAIKGSPDGRITAGHFALLRKLKSEGMLESFVCFDEGSGIHGWDKRDEDMAKNILNKLSKTLTLAVAGNLHTKTEPITFDDEPIEHHPMGENVKKKIPNVASGKIEYLAGQYHNCGIKDLRNDSADNKTPPKARFYKNEDNLYIFELPEAHVATVPNPSERF